MNKTLIVGVVAGLLMGPAALAKSDPELPCELALNGRVAVHVLKPADPKKPTFLLMPGAYRGLLPTDQTVGSLVSAGFGVVTFNYSVQPLSVRYHDDGGLQAIKGPVSIETLAAETKAVADYVARTHGIESLVPVSLSYSAIVSPLLNGHPVVIETVPMTSERAQNPSLNYFKNWIRPWLPTVVSRQTLDATYSFEWNMILHTLRKKHDLPLALQNVMLDGYLHLSRAAEDFEIDIDQLDPSVFRVFVIGTEESPELLKHQLQTIETLRRRGFQVATVIVEGAGHLMPLDHPTLYAKALMAVANGQVEPGSLLVIGPSDKAVMPLETPSAMGSGSN